MDINQAGIDLIKSCEGCRLEAYPDPGTGGDPWTIGYGHTGGIDKGMTITQEQADEFLVSDIAIVAGGVDNLVTFDLTPNQFAAIVCFAYNVGLDNLAKSTLLRCVNAGHPQDAAQEFLKWDRAAGIVMAGLTARRQAERQLFLS